MRDPREEGENIAELDMRAGGEPGHKSFSENGGLSFKLIFRQHVFRVFQSFLKSLRDWKILENPGVNDIIRGQGLVYLSMKVYSASKLSLSGILRGFHPGSLILFRNFTETCRWI